MGIKVSEIGLGVKIIEPQYFEDYRGYYCETYSKRSMEKEGLNTVYIQDNHSYSMKKGTIRGIHFQNNPFPQEKLVRCTNGRVLDYAVDLRRDSPTYKKYVCVELSKENRKQILIPSGFGHAFITLTDECEVLYKVDALYEPQHDRSIKWDDPEIGIDWGIDNPIVSQKDIMAPYLKDSDVNFSLEENK